MSLHLSSFVIPRSSNTVQTLALMISFWLATTVNADTSLGNDAPAPTTTSTSSSKSASSGGLSKTDTIVIGVVVGIVGLLAIIGAVWFFSRRVRVWEEKLERNETIHPYREAKKAAEREHQQHLALQQLEQQMSYKSPSCPRQHEPDLEEGRIEVSAIERDEIRDSMLPKYDPSTFSGHQYSMDSSRGFSLDMPREPLVSYHNRNSLSFSSTISPAQLPPPPPPPPLPPTSWMRRKDTGTSRNTQSTTSNYSRPSNAASTPAVQPSSASEDRPKGPKKPKPTLARLITNL